MRIPTYEGPTDILTWCARMAEQDLVFHPDDPPSEIARVPKGYQGRSVLSGEPWEPLFTPEEVKILEEQIPRIFADFPGGQFYQTLMAFMAYEQVITDED